MAVHIDWLSIVDWLPLDLMDTNGMRRMYQCAEALADKDPLFIESFGWPMTYGIVKSRPPYALARRSEDSTRTLYVHPMASHFLFEVAGSFCTQHPDIVEAAAKRWAGNLSRIDVAVDFQTQVKPTEFAAAISETTVKTRSEFISSTGETVYRGSRSSDRFMRVYRYNHPHPRSHLLRVEFQLKRLYANALAGKLQHRVEFGGQHTFHFIWRLARCDDFNSAWGLILKIYKHFRAKLSKRFCGFL